MLDGLSALHAQFNLTWIQLAWPEKIHALTYTHTEARTHACTHKLACVREINSEPRKREWVCEKGKEGVLSQIQIGT